MVPSKTQMSLPGYTPIRGLTDLEVRLTSLKPGYLIESKRGETSVTRLLTHGDNPVLRIVTDYGQIISTPDHYWLDGENEWVEARRIIVVQKLRFHEVDERATVSSISDYGRDQTFSLVTAIGQYVAFGHISRD